MPYESIKTWDDFNALDWTDKLRYAGFNPSSDILRQEKQRVKGILADSPGYSQGADYYSMLNAAASGISFDDITGGNYNKSAYSYNPQNSVMATDYAASTGTPYSVGWNGGNVMIGGQVIQPDYIKDGKAYVDRQVLDNLIQGLSAGSGVRNNQDIVTAQDSKYGGTYDDLLRRLVNRKEFEYNPETDKLFNIYRDQYTAQGDRAMRDSVGNMAALTGGYASSAAVTAGAQANQQWQDRLMAVIPELQQQAYGRYRDDFDMNRAALGDVMGVDDMQFNRAYGANRDTVGDIRYNEELSRARDNQAYERARDEEQRTYGRAWDEDERAYARLWDERAYGDQRAQLDREYLRQDVADAWNNAAMRGRFTPDEAAMLGIAPNADGTYPSPYDADIQRQLATLERVSRPQMEWEAGLNAKYNSSGGGGSRGGGSGGGSGGSSPQNARVFTPNNIVVTIAGKMENNYDYGKEEAAEEMASWANEQGWSETEVRQAIIRLGLQSEFPDLYPDEARARLMKFIPDWFDITKLNFK